MAKSGISKNRSSCQVKKHCATCGAEFWVKRSHAERRLCCSRKCLGISQRKEKIVLNCSFCGKSIERYPSQYIGENSFCDKTCQNKFQVGDRNPNRKKENDIRIECKGCGIVFYRPPHLAINSRSKEKIQFCNRSCYENYILGKSGVAYNGEVEVVCAWCGKNKKTTHYNYKNGKSFFCDFTCQGYYQSVFTTGESSPSYKGGFSIDNRPSYETYNAQINYKVKTRRSSCGKFLEVTCSYCGKWFEPQWSYLVSVIESTKRQGMDLNIYCSNECKKECPVFWQRKYPKGFKKASSREVDPHLRQMCLERDKWECQKCGATESLHSHHIEGAVQNKMISNDLDNVITLCKTCHKEVHQQEGCQYHELQCKENNKY